MSIGSAQLQFLLRRNQGRLRMEQFLMTASEALGRPVKTIRVTDLEVYDELAKRRWPLHDQRVEERRCWSELDQRTVEGVISQIRDSVDDMPMYLARSLSDWCGLVEAGTHEVLDRAFHLIGFDQEDLVLTSRDGSHRLLLEYGEFLAPSATYSLTPKGSGYRLTGENEPWVSLIRRLVPLSGESDCGQPVEE